MIMFVVQIFLQNDKLQKKNTNSKYRKDTPMPFRYTDISLRVALIDSICRLRGTST